MVGASLKKETQMKLITQFDAAKHTTAELHSLYREAFNAFAAAPRGSEQRRSALASLNNIERVLASRGPRF